MDGQGPTPELAPADVADAGGRRPGGPLPPAGPALGPPASILGSPGLRGLLGSALTLLLDLAHVSRVRWRPLLALPVLSGRLPLRRRRAGAALAPRRSLRVEDFDGEVFAFVHGSLLFTDELLERDRALALLGGDGRAVHAAGFLGGRRGRLQLAPPPARSLVLHVDASTFVLECRGLGHDQLAQGPGLGALLRLRLELHDVERVAVEPLRVLLLPARQARFGDLRGEGSA